MGGFFAFAMFTTLIHVSIFVIVWFTQKDWKRLWLNLQQIQRDLVLPVQFYRRIRNFVWIASLILVYEGT